MSQLVRIDEELGHHHVVQTCCCGSCTVKQGTIILGVLTAVQALISVLGGVSAGAQAGWEEQQRPKTALFIRGLEFVWASIALVVSGLLFRGIATENTKFVRHYLNWRYFTFAIFVVVAVLLGVWVFFSGFSSGIFSGLIASAFYCGFVYLLLRLEWYFLNVVRRYVDELEVPKYSRPENYMPEPIAETRGSQGI